MYITIIYPAYNEEEGIRSTIERSLKELREFTDSFEVLIIDDASRDGTAAIARELAAKNPEVRLYENESNIGQGANLVLGFREARGKFVLHNGMDYPFDMRDLPRMIDAMKTADVVAASRTGRPGYIPYRILVSWINRRLIQFLFPLNLKDYSFVQLYRKDVLDEIAVKSRSTGFVVPETLIRAHDLGYRVVGIDIEYHRRESGLATAGEPKVLIRSFYELIYFWLYRLTPPYRRFLASHEKEARPGMGNGNK